MIVHPDPAIKKSPPRKHSYEDSPLGKSKPLNPFAVTSQKESNEDEIVMITTTETAPQMNNNLIEKAAAQPIDFLSHSVEEDKLT